MSDIREANETFLARYWAKIRKTEEVEGGHWFWEGNLNSKGYGTIQLAGRGSPKIYVHRLAILIAGGKLPEGMVVDHECGIRNCVNPQHLRVTTYSVNNMGENRNNGFYGGPPLGYQLRIPGLETLG